MYLLQYKVDRHSCLLSVPKDIKVVLPTEHTGNQKLSRVLLSCDEDTLAVVLDTKVLFFDVRSVAANVRMNMFLSHQCFRTKNHSK
jgi:hypothetical protein